MSAQISQDFSDPLPCLAEKHLAATFWYNHPMVEAFPFHMGLTLPIFFLGPPGFSGLSRGDRLSLLAETAAPYEFSTTERVDY